MSIYAIGDLHLSFSVDKPMDVFGDLWKDHEKKIKSDWEKQVEPEDLVILAGDISWALKLREALVDLEWIDQLPGIKLLLRGNHDYWWSSMRKMEGLFESLHFLRNNHYVYGDYVIVGTRGWDLPGSHQYNEEDDEKIFNREVERFKLSVASVKKQKLKQEVIAVFHYPPITKEVTHSVLVDIMKAEGITTAIYGHLHGELAWQKAITGEYEGINYIMTSADFLNFSLKKIR